VLDKHLWERLKPWLDEGGIHPPRLSEMLLRDRSLRKRPGAAPDGPGCRRMGNVHAIGAEYFMQTTHLRATGGSGPWELAQADPQQRLNVKESA
jgi:hypothetical protein